MLLTGPCNKCEVGPQNFVESTDKQTDEMGKTMKGNPYILKQNLYILIVSFVSRWGDICLHSFEIPVTYTCRALNRMYHSRETFHCFLRVLNISWHLVDPLFLASVGLAVIGFLCLVAGLTLIVVTKKGKSTFDILKTLK